MRMIIIEDRGGRLASVPSPSLKLEKERYEKKIFSVRYYDLSAVALIISVREVCSMQHTNVYHEKTAAIYARFSSHNQREESIEAQVRACTEYAQRKGLQVVEIYADAA